MRACATGVSSRPTAGSRARQAARNTARAKGRTRPKGPERDAQPVRCPGRSDPAPNARLMGCRYDVGLRQHAWPPCIELDPPRAPCVACGTTNEAHGTLVPELSRRCHNGRRVAGTTILDRPGSGHRATGPILLIIACAPPLPDQSISSRRSIRSRRSRASVAASASGPGSAAISASIGRDRGPPMSAINRTICGVAFPAA